MIPANSNCQKYSQISKEAECSLMRLHEILSETFRFTLISRLRDEKGKSILWREQGSVIIKNARKIRNRIQTE